MKITRAAFIFMASILVGCANHQTLQSKGVANNMSENNVFVLVDNTASMEPTDAIFYVYRNECFVTVYDFPAFKNIKWYAITTIPTLVARDCHFIINRPGSSRLAGGGFWKCIYIQGQGRSSVEWFDQETLDIAKRFKRLRKALILEKYRVSTLPPWIAHRSEIDKRFDLGKDG